MSTRFSVGQKDYITKLNELDDEFQAAIAASPTGLMNSHEAAADPHTQYAKKAGADFTGAISSPEMQMGAGFIGDASAITGLRIVTSGSKNYIQSAKDGASAPIVLGGNWGYAGPVEITDTGIQGPIGQDTPAAGSFTSIKALSVDPYAVAFHRDTDVLSVGTAATILGMGARVGSTPTDAAQILVALEGTGAHGSASVLVLNNGVMQKSVDFTPTGIQGAIGQTAPAAGTFTSAVVKTLNGESVNRVRVATGGVAAWLHLATLPVSDLGTMDHAVIDTVYGLWESPRKTKATLVMGNRNDFTCYWESQGADNTVDAGICAYQQADGSVQVYAYTANGTFATVSASVRLGVGITIPDSVATVTAPSGTKVFDTATSAPMAHTTTAGIRTTAFTNAGALGTNAVNARNHFTQVNAGNAGIASGWIAAAFGDTLGDRVVIGQASGKAIIGSHNGNLADWGGLTFYANEYTFAGPSAQLWGKFDGSGNLGLGVTPSAWRYNYKALQVDTATVLSGSGLYTFLLNNCYFDANDTPTYLTSGAAARYDINRASGIHAWYTAPSGTAGAPISWTQAMTLDANGNLLVGTTTPNSGAKVSITGGDLIVSRTGANAGIGVESVGGSKYYIVASQTGALEFYNGTANTTPAKIDANGNLGIGVTPSAWAAGSALQGNGGAVSFHGSFSALSQNVYFDGAVWRHSAPGGGNLYTMNNAAGHQWFVAPIGAAGDPPSWQQAMALGADGHLQVGTLSNQAYLTVKYSLATLSPAENSVCHISTSDDGNTAIAPYFATGSTLRLQTNANGGGVVDRVVIDSSGNLLVGATSGSAHTIQKSVAEGFDVLFVQGSGTYFSTLFKAVGANGYNTAQAAQLVGKHSTNDRSINAAGTINASGADYAEYMAKADTCGILAKGQIVGVNAEGKLTDKWAEAVSFLIKSTDPSYVGGDTWGSEEALGITRPTDTEAEDYAERLAAFEAALEAARAKVDRIAYAGQVPVNVYSANVGDYIIPVQDGEGIKGVAVAENDMTLKQYMKAVGIVQNILPDGRANVRVKVC